VKDPAPITMGGYREVGRYEELRTKFVIGLQILIIHTVGIAITLFGRYRWFPTTTHVFYTFN